MLNRMTTSPAADAPRRGRPPRGSTPGLSRVRVLGEALALVDEEGVEEVSMRKLARRLAVDPMSLYNHVDNKDAILDGITELILASAEFPAPTSDLRTDLLELARAFRRAMLRHPRAAPLVLTRQLSSSQALAPTEIVLTTLRRAGLSPQDAVHAMRAMLAFLIGTLMREVSAGPTFGAGDAEAIRSRRAELAESGLPMIAEAAPYLATCDHEAEFEFGLRVLLEALDAELARTET
jgi:TetR/AcrR family tetracycline transcriptional repressor